ncbi:MoxR family ATPase [Chitinophaga silvatica]|uniref:MoxR family ATPase n=1 Tax=Chitinophaga silvatica TaxID=2282649 RepID=A0A3E1YHK1_9BACT|nr:MoxR family ATPase [Chitinophaga silvatica]RFS26925.1 MoxR family ATPase [Chitinophaga silvatica]
MSHRSYLSEKLAKTESINRKGYTEKLYPYFADDELKKAVNLALFLNRPLLLMGEPGCGKSLLAKAIAYEWYEKEMYDRNKYFEWNVKSTSKAREGLYDYDHLLRLRDAYDKSSQLEDNNRYLRYGPMSEAMVNSTKEAKAVLLIDEIDKADIDFSNDLLLELERNSFYIPETNKTVTHDQDAKPFIIITSNGEKDLSDAFLRRCVFHYIDIFSSNKIDSKETRDWLKNIVKARFYDEQEVNSELLDKAINTFVSLRKEMNRETNTFRKVINTSEFLDWYTILKACLEQQTSNQLLDQEYDRIHGWLQKQEDEKPHIGVPFGNVLFKTTASLFNFKSIS